MSESTPKDQGAAASKPSVRNPTVVNKPGAPLAHLPSRDTVTTINEDGSRYDIHPADVSGRFTTWRRRSAMLLIAIYLLLPWIPVAGYPAVFLDLASRRFHFFGYTLAAQDGWLLFFAVSGLGFTLFFLTSLLGRLWCGWTCPQTVFLEHVFRRIERWIDGDATARRVLKAAPLSASKIFRRIAKHSLFVFASLIITHLFLAYFVSIPQLWTYMHDAPGENWGAFLFVFIAAGILYFNFAWFREQLCIIICPYGRLQSALTDDNTMVIGYDAKRGEPRGKLGTPDAGACISCNRCIQVCPTGIDIRHGLQLECIGCAACVDACDEIMTKVKRPTGLIRYASLIGLAGGKTHWIRPRTILYSIMVVIGMAVAGFAFSTVKPAYFLVMRMNGSSYYVSPEDVRDQFMVRIVNKRTEAANFTLTLRGLPPGVRQTGFTAPVRLQGLGEQISPLIIFIDRKNYTGPFSFYVDVVDDTHSYTLSRQIEFLGPDARLLHADGAN